MADATSPDGIYLHTAVDPTSLVALGQALGATVQAALNKRERYTYVWPTSAERTAETGMTQGSLGYQVDTRSEYVYDNSNWRRATAYAEWTHPNQTIPNAVETLITAPTLDSAASTDSTFTTSATGYIQFRDPGIYIVSWVVSSSVNSANPYIKISPDAAGLITLALGGQVGTIGMTSTPFYAPTANYRLYFWIRQGTGSNQTYDGRIRVIRIA